MVIPGNDQLQEPTAHVLGMWGLRALVEEPRELLLFLSHYERLSFSRELKNTWLLEEKNHQNQPNNQNLQGKEEQLL